ncbi:MAG TPA: FAD:protein FMN transferase, partial [Candidatus Polarisedimenticolia bacterium]|nr:FAD:protein FMN transferase [Candidatus Polarisedimenticolia bacterium]
MLRLSPCFLLPALLAMGLAAAAASPAADHAPVTRQRYLMGTPCEGIVHPAAAPGSRERAAAALEAALEEIARLESILSDYRADSELSGLNGAEPGEAFACSEDLFQFLALSQRLSALTGGAFDLTVGPLVRAWGLRTGGRAP